MNRILLLAVASTLCARSLCQEWTRFRGPNGTGISESKSIPSKWGASNFLWKSELPGEGHSAPVVWGTNLFVTGTTAGGNSHQLYCLDSVSGELRWKREVPYRQFAKHQYNSFASCTPAVDAAQVYFSWAVPERYSLASYTQGGDKVWEIDLGPYKSQHGPGASPMLHGDLVILANEQDGDSFIIAVNKKTGKTVWKTPRRPSAAAYGTPCILRDSQGRDALLFTSQAEGIAAINAADGKPLWALSDVFDKRSVSSPVVAHGMVFGSCGSGAGGTYLVAVEIPKNPGEAPKEKYRMRTSAPYVPTSIAYKDWLFTWSDNGFASCLNVDSGNVLWQERVDGRFFGSPVCVDGRLFCVSDKGEVVVLRAGPQFEILARNSLDEPSHSTPAIANDRMFVRTLRTVHCIGASHNSLSTQ